MTKMMKITVMIILAVVLMLACSAVQVHGATNKRLVKNYCHKNYPECTIKYFKNYNPDIMENRANKSVVYVEVIKSKSCGKYGRTKEGYRIAYNKKVRKNKKVTSYCIYNPYNNYCDDVVAVVDNRRIR